MNTKQCDVIVAGAGIWGCTVARRLAEAGKKVLVLEKRKAIGGNCRCKTIDGIEVHLYGSHIFHTKNEEVWKFVNRFVSFNDYRHSVLAKTRMSGQRSEVRGQTADGFYLYHLPIGKTLTEEFFGVNMKDRNLKDFLSQPSTNLKPSTFNPQPGAPRTNGEALFDAFIRGYTSKQWGVPPEKVDPSIIARLKVRDNYSTDYFDDPYQGIPADGYNELFRRLLDHPNIWVQCNCALAMDATGKWVVIPSNDQLPNDSIQSINRKIEKSKNIYYSGPIDELFSYKFGPLPWRSLRFETETLPITDYQGATVVNYTDAEIPYTRIHEFKHYHPEWVRSRSSELKSKNGISNHHSSTSTSTSNFDSLSSTSNVLPSQTVIMREYPTDWRQGDEPYYPINTPESAALFAKYQEAVEELNQLSSTSTSNFDFLTIGGRLGQYKYYDMDKSIAAALEVEI